MVIPFKGQEYRSRKPRGNFSQNENKTTNVYEWKLQCGRHTAIT